MWTLEIGFQLALKLLEQLAILGINLKHCIIVDAVIGKYTFKAYIAG